MATLADKINEIQVNVAEIKTKVDALETGTAVDLTPVTNALVTVQATVDGIKAELTPTFRISLSNSSHFCVPLEVLYNLCIIRGDCYARPTHIP